MTVCDIPVAKQNFRQRHGHGLIYIQAKNENDDIGELKFDVDYLPQMDDTELNCFFEWIQNYEKIFE
jgi:hypothetical protein